MEVSILIYGKAPIVFFIHSSGGITVQNISAMAQILRFSRKYERKEHSGTKLKGCVGHNSLELSKLHSKRLSDSSHTSWSDVGESADEWLQRARDADGDET